MTCPFNCGRPWCNGECYNDCPYHCMAPGCHGECHADPNPGGGSGGGGGYTPPVEPPTPPTPPATLTKENLKSMADSLPDGNALKGMIEKAYNNPDFKFVADTSIVSLSIDITFDSHTKKIKKIRSIRYNQEYHDDRISDMGNELGLLHEFCHPHLLELDTIPSNHHNAMQTNEAFDAAIKKLYPGYTDEQYKYMRLSNAVDATDYTSMGVDDQKVMNSFLGDNKIVHTIKVDAEE